MNRDQAVSVQIEDLGRELAEARKEHEDFLEECGKMIPESYDTDDSIESIILRYLKDMESLAGIVARLTSSYR